MKKSCVLFSDQTIDRPYDDDEEQYGEEGGFGNEMGYDEEDEQSDVVYNLVRSKMDVRMSADKPAKLSKMNCADWIRCDKVEQVNGRYSMTFVDERTGYRLTVESENCLKD